MADPCASSRPPESNEPTGRPGRPGADCVLEVRGLTKRFGSRVAVDNLSLSVYRGDVYGFLGPNGAGKTTTLRMLTGLIRPHGGAVYIAGDRLTFWNRRPLRKIGASIEAPAFYGFLSCRDNLRIFADLSGPCPIHRIDAVLDRVGMTRRAGDRMATYSHGMKQRLAIAAALLPQPEVVLLDEPTNGLDPMGIHDTRELIRTLARDDGYTILLSSHLLAEVEQVCNRGAIVVEGKRLWEGQVADLLTSRRVRLRVTGVDSGRRVLDELGARVTAADSGDATLYAEGDIPAHRMVAALVQAGCEVHEVITEAPSLEQVFLALVHDSESHRSPAAAGTADSSATTQGVP